MKEFNAFKLSFLALALTFLGPALAFAQPNINSRKVNQAMVFALDISSSVDADEFILQRDGLAAAFRDPEVISAIAECNSDGIGVRLYFWGGSIEELPNQAGEWRKINDSHSSLAFARAISSTQRLFEYHNTNLRLGLETADDAFAELPFATDKRSLSVSGDGIHNAPKDPSATPDEKNREIETMRDRLVQASVSINALIIDDGQKQNTPESIKAATDVDGGLESYFQKMVVGGGGFSKKISTYQDYAGEIKRQVLRMACPVTS